MARSPISITSPHVAVPCGAVHSSIRSPTWNGRSMINKTPAIKLERRILGGEADGHSQNAGAGDERHDLDAQAAQRHHRAAGNHEKTDDLVEQRQRRVVERRLRLGDDLFFDHPQDLGDWNRKAGSTGRRSTRQRRSLPRFGKIPDEAHAPPDPSPIWRSTQSAAGARQYGRRCSTRSGRRSGRAPA